MLGRVAARESQRIERLENVTVSSKPWKRKRKQRARLKAFLKSRERRRVTSMLKRVGVNVNEDFTDNALDDWS